MALAREDDPKNRVIQFPHVGNPSAWPKASSDKACIFEAIQIIGAALHGQSWDGTEFNVVWWHESPKDEYARAMAIAADQKLKTASHARRPAVSVARAQGAGMIRSISTTDLLRRIPRDDHIRVWRLENRQ